MRARGSLFCKLLLTFIPVLFIYGQPQGIYDLHVNPTMTKLLMRWKTRGVKNPRFKITLHDKFGRYLCTIDDDYSPRPSGYPPRPDIPDLIPRPQQPEVRNYTYDWLIRQGCPKDSGGRWKMVNGFYRVRVEIIRPPVATRYALSNVFYLHLTGMVFSLEPELNVENFQIRSSRNFVVSSTHKHYYHYSIKAQDIERGGKIILLLNLRRLKNSGSEYNICMNRGQDTRFDNGVFQITYSLSERAVPLRIGSQTARGQFKALEIVKRAGSFSGRQVFHYFIVVREIMEQGCENINELLLGNVSLLLDIHITIRP